MKKNISALHILLVLFYIINTPLFGKSFNLNEVIQTKKVNCFIYGNSSSTHYLEPVILELVNNTNEMISINLENGDMFIPSDSDKQNIVITQNELIILNPKQKQNIKIKGMCTESGNASGNGETVYTFKNYNDTKLKKLADFIGSKHYQSSAAQYAVWSLMNNEDINTVYSSDSTEEMELKRFMAALTGKTFAVKTKDYRYNYYTPPKEKVGGNFEYSFSKTQDIQIAMFDKNGILIRELFNQKNVPAGNHKLNFEYDSSVYTDDVYYFKLIVGNEIMVNRKWDAQAMRDSFKKKIENRE